MPIRPGFRGIARFNGSHYLRFTSADIQLKQEAMPFLPSYGGSELKRIWHIGTGDISGTISGPLIENDAEYFYDLAKNKTEFYIDIHYYSGQTKRAIGCVIDNLSFNCNAGEAVQISMNVIAKDLIKKSNSISYTKGKKIVTWDKCAITISGYSGSSSNYQGFTYNINNGFKSIKTAKSLTPSIISQAIQDVSGQVTVYNFNDLVYPHRGTELYELDFPSTEFKIDDLIIVHDIVLHPSEVLPLTTSSVVSTIAWTRHDDFITE